MTTRQIAEQFTILSFALDLIRVDRTTLTLCELRWMVSHLERACAAEGVDVSRLAREMRCRIDRFERDRYASVAAEVRARLEVRGAA